MQLHKRDFYRYIYNRYVATYNRPALLYHRYVTTLNGLETIYSRPATSYKILAITYNWLVTTDLQLYTAGLQVLTSHLKQWLVTTDHTTGLLLLTKSDSKLLPADLEHYIAGLQLLTIQENCNCIRYVYHCVQGFCKSKVACASCWTVSTESRCVVASVPNTAAGAWY